MNTLSFRRVAFGVALGCTLLTACTIAKASEPPRWIKGNDNVYIDVNSFDWNKARTRMDFNMMQEDGNIIKMGVDCESETIVAYLGGDQGTMEAPAPTEGDSPAAAIYTRACKTRGTGL